MTAKPGPTKQRLPWPEIISTKRSIRDVALQKYQTERDHSLDTTFGETIVDINEITKLLETGQVSALELTLAYIGR